VGAPDYSVERSLGLVRVVAYLSVRRECRLVVGDAGT
jgi:hypothetical protein